MFSGVYTPKNWHPCIPGTVITRVEFIMTMREVWESPLSKKEAFLSETLRRLAQPGVLNATQISAVTGHSVPFVITVAELMRLELPSTRSIFDPQMLPLIHECCRGLAQGKGVPRDQLAVLCQTVGGSLLESLLGIPQHTSTNIRADYRKYELELIEQTEWEVGTGA